MKFTVKACMLVSLMCCASTQMIASSDSSSSAEKMVTKNKKRVKDGHVSETSSKSTTMKDDGKQVRKTTRQTKRSH